MELYSAKDKAISKLPAPSNLPELRSFMVLVIEMSGHLEKFNEAALSRQPLLKKKKNSQRVEEQQSTMDKVKELLPSP